MPDLSPQIRTYVARDRSGSSSPWGHCNLCPRANTDPCSLSCAKVREEKQAEDGIKVEYLALCVG